MIGDTHHIIEHLRQHERTTVTDQAVEARALAYQEAGTEPIVEHLVSARSLSASASALS